MRKSRQGTADAEQRAAEGRRHTFTSNTKIKAEMCNVIFWTLRAFIIKHEGVAPKNEKKVVEGCNISGHLL
jgi:hypothetical protein